MSSRRVREKLREMRIARDFDRDDSRATREKNELLDSLTKAELIGYAEANGIEIDKTAKKADIIVLLGKAHSP